MEPNRYSTSRFTEQSDSLTITAEVTDIVMNPLQCQNLIVQTLITWRFRPVEVEKAEAVQPVLHRDDDDIIRRRQHSAIVQIQCSRSSDESSAVDPHEYGHRCRCLRTAHRHPNVQIQTVLAAIGVGRPDLFGFEIVDDLFGLPAGRRQARGVEYSRPGVDTFGSFETARARGRLGERNTEPGANMMKTWRIEQTKVGVETAHATGVG